MSITKKAVITLAAGLITASFSTASFAEVAVLIDLMLPSPSPPVCFYVFGGQICVAR